MTTIESFRAALKKLLELRGYGSASDMADALHIHRSVVSDIAAGRRGASAKMQERIASHFGLTMSEMLRIGEHLVAGRVVFPWRDQLEGLDRGEQLIRIMELTNSQVGHPDDAIPFMRQAIEFLTGEGTPAEVYQTYLRLIRSRKA